MSWTGVVQLDMLVYETLKGTLDFDKRGPLYLMHVILTLPDGVADISLECLADYVVPDNVSCFTPFLVTIKYIYFFFIFYVAETCPNQ